MADKAKPAEPEAEAAWQRNRRLRQEALDAANEHGQQLAQRYGYGAPRQRYAVTGYANMKRRMRRR